MDMECNNITKFVLPAMRISIAEQLGRKYKLNQKEIADRLGVAQVAVSKYLNGDYSSSLKKVVEQVKASGIVDSGVIARAKAKNPRRIERMVNDLCSKFVNNNMVNL
jgi:predicted transcriptional regulator